jgi:(1->4)-alpha-D-glucan 1-alpha-D-glucosylmutase
MSGAGLDQRSQHEPCVTTVAQWEGTTGRRSVVNNRTVPVVTGTYRLQLRAGFGFEDALAQVPYLSRLGVSHLYLSPILTAVQGSMHGYDVLDHSRVSEALGGERSFRELCEAAHARGLGVVVDVVPNHMAVPAPEWANAPLWQVLREGRTAATAGWFDIDWDAGEGRLGLPMLGDTLERTLAAGELTRDQHDGEPVIRYHEHAFPVSPSTDSGDLATVLARQHYRLASWRERDQVMNYRRFFEVDQLIGVRVEDPAVFEATHRLLLDLHHEGLIDGFRIDHPDGLADPEGYLARLADACVDGTPVWVEKVLEGEEELPAPWQTAGTTGYDALQAISSALVDPGTTAVLSGTWAEVGGAPDLDGVIEECKRHAAADLLQPEVNRLHRRAVESIPHLAPDRLREALVELLVATDVYRAYVRPGHPTSVLARAHAEEALSRARVRRPDLGDALDAVAGVALEPDPSDPAAVDLAIRFQQTCGPVMAKGIEDSAFYRWHRLTALCEVGGDPTVAEHPDAEELHRWASRQQDDWPTGMTARSTHDTKRSEDVRARILAVAGDAQAWERCSAAFADAAAAAGVDGPTGHLLWQTLVGAGPLEPERLRDYLLKAVREAKEHTAWIDGDPDYERRVLTLAERACAPGPLRDVVAEAVRSNADAIRATVLATTLLGLCLPGVPDTYQGCEVVDLSLVDPDNRRPVDYADRSRRLEALEQGIPPDDLSGEKLLVTSRTLRLRRQHPEWFGAEATYAPLATPSHLFGFLRSGGVAVLVSRLPHAAASGIDPVEPTIALPEGRWRDELTGRSLAGGPVTPSDVFTDLPVALLVSAADGADR